MLDRLFRCLVPSGDYNEKESREKITVFAGFLGIVLNVLLFAIKFTAGSLFGIVSVTADAFNNLSDCGSSVVSVIGSKLSGKSPDKEHPYGHARIEYIASLCISFIILFLGVSLFYTSFLRVLNPQDTKADLRVILVIAISVLVKLWLFLFNKKGSKLIGSTVLKAVALDSLSDSAATAAVLVSLIISPVVGYDLDGVAGMIVAALILKEGASIIKETLGHIIGSPADKQLIDELTSYILSHKEIISAHDLIIHSYGPNRLFASIHAELDGGMTLLQAHSIVDAIEKGASRQFGIEILIHMDPAMSETPQIRAIKEFCEKEVNLMHDGLNMHDFRIDGETVSFEVSKPYGMNIEKEKLKEILEKRISEKLPDYHIEILVDEIFTQN